MTSLQGPGERNFNAASHKQTRAPIQSVTLSFGLWDKALKFLSPGPRNDVTHHLEVKSQTRINLHFRHIPRWVQLLDNGSAIAFFELLCDN